MPHVADSVERIARELIRRMVQPRVGSVTKVDTSQTHKLYTIDGLYKVRSIVDVVVGDVVFWIPGRDGVIIGKPIVSP